MASPLFRKLTLAFALASTAACGPYNRFEDINQKPDACANVSDSNEMYKRVPELARDFNLMAQLPLTGQPIYDVLADTSNHITACTFHVEGKREIIQSYSNRRILVDDNAGTTVTIHEAGHGAQDMKRPLTDKFMMAARDAGVGVLLTEATMLALELMTKKEADNHGVSFNEKHSFVSSVTPFYDERKHLSDEDGIQTAFNDAYKRSWKENTALDAQTHEAKALESGGKAVVRYLMAGKSTAWNSLYKDAANRNLDLFAEWLDYRSTRQEPQYVDLRDRLYLPYGTILPGINILPEEYLGPNAQAAIDAAFKKFGLHDMYPPEVSSLSTRLGPMPRYWVR